MISTLSFSTNVPFLILCLNINIDNTEPTLPPTNEEIRSLFSETLWLFFSDCSLSYAYSINEKEVIDIR